MTQTRIDQLCVVTYSPTRTSYRIAQAVAEGIGIARRTDYDLTTNRDTSALVLSHALCVVAVPVYGGLIAPVAAQRIARLQGQGSVVVPVVVYGNRDYEDALVQLRELLAAQGFVPLCGAAFVGEHSYSRRGMPIAEGRPDEADLLQARRFGQAAYVRLCRLLDYTTPPDAEARDFCLTHGQPLHSLVTAPPMRGNVPWKVLPAPTPQMPVVGDACHGCGLCADLCPTGAIRMEQGRSATSLELCTKCCACVKGCPVGARVFDTPYTARLHVACAARREPECFV